MGQGLKDIEWKVLYIVTKKWGGHNTHRDPEMHNKHNILPSSGVIHESTCICIDSAKTIYSSCLFVAYNVIVGGKVKVSKLWIELKWHESTCICIDSAITIVYSSSLFVAYNVIVWGKVKVSKLWLKWLLSYQWIKTSWTNYYCQVQCKDTLELAHGPVPPEKSKQENKPDTIRKKL